MKLGQIKEKPYRYLQKTVDIRWINLSQPPLNSSITKQSWEHFPVSD